MQDHESKTSIEPMVLTIKAGKLMFWRVLIVNLNVLNVTRSLVISKLIVIG